MLLLLLLLLMLFCIGACDNVVLFVLLTVYMVTTCLANREMLGNFLAVADGAKVGEIRNFHGTIVSWITVAYIASFMVGAAPVFPA